jgi:hypothetical protein
MAREQRRALLEHLEDIRKSRVICCVTSDRVNAPGIIAKDFIRIFYNHLRAFGDVQRVDVFLFTTGGDTLAAFGISRLLREFADHVGALIPEQCHSAGTLLILGANEIFMTPAATLSPIDPSVQTPLNPKAEGPMPGMSTPFPVSVENIAGFEDLTEEEWRLSPQGRSDAFCLLAKEVHPLVLGQAYRTRQQIERLAEVLLRTHRKDSKNIRNIVQQLTHGLGSHDYLISRKEAKDIFGQQVVGDAPDRRLETAVWNLQEDFREEMQLGRVFDPMAIMQQEISRGRQTPVTITNRLVTIETIAATDVWESDWRLTPVQAAGPPIPSVGVQQMVVYNGWRHYE